MAAESCEMCLFEAMDHLWFGQIITFPLHNLFPITSKTSSKNISQISVTVSDQQISSAPSAAMACSQVETKSHESYLVQETSTAAGEENLVSSKTGSNTCSPTSARKQSRISETSVSCKSLEDLELEELKGFMDLGFVFKKENLSRHTICLIPGLQRMNCEGDEEGKMRPYLSEAWLDSPLILSIGICKNSDSVKKHLKNWARTVAAAIHQQS